MARRADKFKLNIGPGKNWRRDGWMTVDYYNNNATFVLDLRESPRLPLPSHSVAVVFCSHVIEHLDDAAVASLFKEVQRVLAFDGTFRVSCPDAKKAVAQYKKGNCDPQREVVTPDASDAPSHHRLLNVLASFRAKTYKKRKNTRTGYSGGPIASKITVTEHVNRDTLEELSRWAVGLIPDNAVYRAHINAHWPEKVVRLLSTAGFQNVRSSKFRKSRVRELRDEAFDNRPNLSLFVEAQARGFVKRFGTKLFQLKSRLFPERGLSSMSTSGSSPVHPPLEPSQVGPPP